MEGLEFWVDGVGCGVWGVGCGVEGLGLLVWLMIWGVRGLVLMV